MDITQYDFEIKRHAFIRAMERKVTPDMIEATLKGGKIERFGRHNIRFIKDYKNFTVICVGQMLGTTIKIFTIETKGAEKS
ncbi:hypothetical protein KY347_00985 [Candidatus Woesearchaeota archaeon]|nr:hypothetical protein [Candidatus Woesearchaeota archaeon]